MSTFLDVNPETFLDRSRQMPPHGRGAWRSEGTGWADHRFGLHHTPRMGNQAELSLAHWAVSAGVDAIQRRLVTLGFLEARPVHYRGNFGTGTRDAVAAFQKSLGWAPLGIVGHGTALELFTPVIDAAAGRFGIPDRRLRGLIFHESGGLDPAAVGWYIYYARTDGTIRYGGVDRALAMVNSLQHGDDLSWVECYDPTTACRYAASRMHTTFTDLSADFPNRPAAMVWDAAVCSHNSPANARAWLRDGAPNEAAAKYVNSVMMARY